MIKYGTYRIDYILMDKKIKRSKNRGVKKLVTYKKIENLIWVNLIHVKRIIGL